MLILKPSHDAPVDLYMGPTVMHGCLLPRFLGMALTFPCLQGSVQCLAHSREVLYKHLEEEQMHL